MLSYLSVGDHVLIMAGPLWDYCYTYMLIHGALHHVSYTPLNKHVRVSIRINYNLNDPLPPIMIVSIVSLIQNIHCNKTYPMRTIIHPKQSLFIQVM